MVKFAKFEIWKLFSKPQNDGYMVTWLQIRGIVCNQYRYIVLSYYINAREKEGDGYMVTFYVTK